MSELLNLQIERLESAIELSKDWLEIQYLMAELNQLKDLYPELNVDAAWLVVLYPSSLNYSLFSSNRIILNTFI